MLASLGSCLQHDVVSYAPLAADAAVVSRKRIIILNLNLCLVCLFSPNGHNWPFTSGCDQLKGVRLGPLHDLIANYGKAVDVSFLSTSSRREVLAQNLGRRPQFSWKENLIRYRSNEPCLTLISPGKRGGGSGRNSQGIRENLRSYSAC